MKYIPRFKPSFSIWEIILALRSSLSSKNKDVLCIFADKFARYIGVRYAIPVPSARVAFMAILEALKLPQGGEVIMPSLTFHCIPSILKEFGLRPRFVDIDLNTNCIDVNKLTREINSSTVAIIPVHLYGYACNMQVIREIADRFDLKIIEDCAQACGGVYRGRRLGSFGDAAIFSFHCHKNFSLLGTGMLVTDSKDLAEKAASWVNSLNSAGPGALIRQIIYAIGLCVITYPLLWRGFMVPVLSICNYLGFDFIETLTNESCHGQKKDYRKRYLMPGVFHGFFGLCQLAKIDGINKRRIENGEALTKHLGNAIGIAFSSFAPFGENIFSSFVVRVKRKKEFRMRLFRRGIDSHGGNMFVGPLLPEMEGTGEFANALEAKGCAVHLPIYHQITSQDLLEIADAVKFALKE